MDNLTVEQRLKNMRRIRSTNSAAEKIVMRELLKRKIYFTKHVKSIVGKPDIVFRRRKVIVFIDSEFWHKHPDRCVIPKTNRNYWERKLNRNQERDLEVNAILRAQGWTVLRLWEYEVKRDTERVMLKILSSIRSDPQLQISESVTY